MEEEEPMELSGDRSRNGSFLHDFQSNSLSDMDVDESFDRSYSAARGNSFSFQAMSATIATSRPFQPIKKDMSATIATSTPSKQIKRETPIRMRSLVTKKMSQDEEKQKLHCDENLNSLLKTATLLIQDKKDKKQTSRSKSKELSPRESRINRRKSGNENNIKRQLYLWLFVSFLFVLFSTFVIIHQKCHIHMDIDKFEHIFDQNVFGQHIAKYVLTNTLRNISKRMQNDTKLSSNPLVFSFHGWTGVGKNFVTKQLLYGFDNARVTTFLVPLHFPHKSEDERYKDEIQRWVKGNITMCYVNLFVFDEMDKATPGLLEGLLNVMKQIQLIEMEKTWIIFLFLSNSRGHQINNFLFTEMSRGKQRNEITFDQILPVLNEDKSSDEWYKEFNRQALIDTFVPFLPLSKHHVHQCIEKDLLKKGRQPSAELIDLISDEMHYIQPIKDGDTFSITGCKRVSDKVDLHL